MNYRDYMSYEQQWAFEAAVLEAVRAGRVTETELGTDAKAAYRRAVKRTRQIAQVA